jgi:3-dehydroquinate dehydratase/shikimate dehydrogenase
MGPAGAISRILAKVLGGFVSFASLDAQSATAPGQVTIDDMINLYNWRSLNKKTRVFGVIADPVGHSMSPAIFNAVFKETSADAVYLPLLVAGEKDCFFDFMENVSQTVRDGIIKFAGFSVTVPHKAHAMEYAQNQGEYVDALTAGIGAVNTLKAGYTGRVSAYNTDYAGAIDALVDAMGTDRSGLHNVKAAVIGAGGAARAVVAGLRDAGAQITIYNRTLTKAKDLAGEFKCTAAGLDDLKNIDAAVVINCTSLGMSPNVDNTPLDKSLIKPDMVVFDTVYNPLETKLLKEAAEKGAVTISGVEMFIRQALLQYKHFTGNDPAGEVERTMRKTVMNKLKAK